MLLRAHASIFRRAATPPRWAENAAALLIVLLCACVPDLQPQVPPGSQCVDAGQRVSYADAPESLKTEQLEDAFVQYAALGGQWAVEVRCPADSATARTLDFSVETRSRGDIYFQPLCSGDVAAVTKCRISFSGQGFPELAGQSSEFDVLLSPGPKVNLGRLSPGADYPLGSQMMNPSYDSTLDFLSVEFAVDSTSALRSVLVYGFKPYQNSQGGMSQTGYDCISENAVRVGP
jgi:hypothetical protein